MSIPAPDEYDGRIPVKVAEVAGDAPLVAVWTNSEGGVTFRAGSGVGARYIKWQSLDAEVSLADEAVRAEWARQFTNVPLVLSRGTVENFEWLESGAIVGESAVAPRWVDNPDVAVRAVGRGLRELHEALPVAECEWDWGVEARIAHAAARGIIVPAELHDTPPVDRLVVAHGDACCPNTVLDESGRPVGHVDLGSLGVADRWADIAVASMSTARNYGGGWEDTLIEAYGVEPDRERLTYYRNLWNAT